MNYGKIEKYDVSNGTGVRVSVWFTGCCHQCPLCFNRDYWDEKSGELFDDEAKDKLFTYLSDPHIKGLSVLGGEPLIQGEELVELLKEVKSKFPTKDIWLWTGYYIDGREELTETQRNILSLCDYVVDGRFINELKDLSLNFRGSSNQTIWVRNNENNQFEKSPLNN